MAQRSKEYLKGRFSTGKKPSEEDFADLIDSMVHYSDLEAVNATTIDARINEYDTALKAQSGLDAVTTLGDILYVMRGVLADGDVQADINAAGGEVSWGTVTGKPVSALVQWDEYTFTLDNYSQPPITSYESITFTRIVEDNMPANVKTATAGKKWQLLDVAISNVQIKMNDTGMIYPVSRLRSVKIGVNPRIAFPA